MAKSLCVLIAEDDVVNQRIAARLLEQAGHTVVLAANGREALAAWEMRPFDLVLMDIQMPLMNGFDTTAEIRKREARRVSALRQDATPSRTPIVAVSATAVREHCLAAGMDGFIAKPYGTQELFAAIDTFVSSAAHEY